MADIIGRKDPSRGDPTEGSLETSTRAVPAWRLGESAALLTIDRSLYSKRVVLAAAYKFSDRLAVLVDIDSENRWAIYFLGSNLLALNQVLEAFAKELTDQALREQLEQDFGAVRDLIVAQAFSEGNLLEDTADRTSKPGDA